VPTWTQVTPPPVTVSGNGGELVAEFSTASSASSFGRIARDKVSV
jgi:hypothetical protein